MNTNWIMLGLTLLVAMASCEAQHDPPSNLRMDLSSLFKEAKNAVKQEKMRRMLRRSEKHRMRMEAAAARADDAVMSAIAAKDLKAAKEAHEIAKEMHKAVVEARSVIRNMREAELKIARRQRVQVDRRSNEDRRSKLAVEISENGSPDDPTDPAADASDEEDNATTAPEAPEASEAPEAPEAPEASNETKAPNAAQKEIIDPDETSSDVKKLVKKTHESLEKKPNHDVIINKGMTKDEVKMNGENVKKLVKESEDKKANGEEIVDKQANLEIDRDPKAKQDAEKARAGAESGAILHKVGSFFVMIALTFVLVV